MTVTDIYEFDQLKNLLLKKERDISFEQVITLIESRQILRISSHPNQARYPHQFIYEIEINGYVYIVPFIKTGNRIFLKTIFPSRKANRKHGASRDKKD